MKTNTEVFGSLLEMKTVLVFCSLILSGVGKYEELVVQALSVSIGDMVNACQKELEFGNDVIQDLLNFWNETNELRSTDLGCALVCVFEKNEFLNEDGTQVQVANVDTFFRSAGADDIMSHKMVELFKLCKEITRPIKDMCDAALEMSKCFRYGILQMQWAPDLSFWNGTEVNPNSEPEQVSDETLRAALRGETNKRKIFSKLFRNCRK